MKAFVTIAIIWAVSTFAHAAAQDASPYLVQNLSETESLSFRVIRMSSYGGSDIEFEIDGGGVLQYREATRQLSPDQISGIDAYTEYLFGLNERGACTAGVFVMIERSSAYPSKVSFDDWSCRAHFTQEGENPMLVPGERWIRKLFTFEEMGVMPSPIAPPRFQFPDTDLSGECLISFSIAEDGTPFNIIPNCTNPAFDQAATTGLSAGRWLPQQIEQHGLTMPILFDQR